MYVLCTVIFLTVDKNVMPKDLKRGCAWPLGIYITYIDP